MVIPAHDEARTIARTLAALRDGAPDDLEVVVVCNGCTDDTATVARSVVPPVQVLEIVEASKAAAVIAGNAAASGFPRVHLDADVELRGSSVQLLAASLGDGVLATAPRREVPRTGCSIWVRAYYDVWEALPQVRAGLFGRGVLVLSEEGQRRVSALPTLMSDDLAVSEVFEAHERRVVDQASVVVHPPRTLGDLLRRRVRVSTGNAQADDAGIRRSESVTSPEVLVRMVVREPRLLVRMPVFLAVAVVARLRSRRAVRAGDFSTWQRDESSRSG
ncbi:MAG: glycosyl transferase [Nocardioidaceae bacterium]|nr:glycosyl transferase [Nocardioidaceae bacterium]